MKMPDAIKRVPIWAPRLFTRRIPLRLRLALWSGGLALIVTFTLVLFINTIALGSFPRIIQVTPTFLVKIEQHVGSHLAGISVSPKNGVYQISTNPLERALLLELRSISLTGFMLVALITGVGAYLLSGAALRPVRRVREAAQRISASTLDTRLALDGPRDEIKEMADTFDAMLERLQQTFEQQGRFVADVAHELRTPLASLRTNLEVVTSDCAATLEDYQTMAATQERALTRLERVVDDLLMLAKSEQPPEHSRVALGPLLEEVCEELQPAACAHEVILHLVNECGSDCDIVVQGDSALLARVFSNLVENGIHYNRSGGKVTIMLDQKENWAIVRVSDTGIGITLEQQAHIFERFHRVDGSRARHIGGAGLGLSIVAAIAQQHGGHVQVESTPGVGSIFTTLLPLANENDTEIS